MESSVLTDVLRNIQALCGANGVIMEEAKSLLRILMPIDFVFAVLLNMMSFGGNGYIPLLFSKIMKYGFGFGLFLNGIPLLMLLSSL